MTMPDNLTKAAHAAPDAATPPAPIPFSRAAFAAPAFAVTLSVFCKYGDEPKGQDPFSPVPETTYAGHAGSLPEALALCFDALPFGQSARYHFRHAPSGFEYHGWIGRDACADYAQGGPEAVPFAALVSK